MDVLEGTVCTRISNANKTTYFTLHYKQTTNTCKVLYTYIGHTLVNALHGLLNCETGGLDCRVITTEYRTRVHCIHMNHLFFNPLVHVIYSGVSGQCFSYNTS